MAVKVKDEAVTPKSTGAVETPGPVTVEQVADNTSTDAVAYQAPGDTNVGHYDSDVVVVQPTPGPVTMTVSWLGDSEAPDGEAETAPADEEQSTEQAKVVTAPEPTPVETSAVEVETK